MEISISDRLAGISNYTFDEIDRKVEELRSKGLVPIDFGVGDPTEPTPDVVRAAIKRGVEQHARGGYPDCTGSPDFRRTIASWIQRRFGVALDPGREICATIGAKEAIFNFPEAFVNPGDVVLVPNPGYPPYARGARFAEGEVYYLNLSSENGFLPDLGSVPADVCRKAKILWLNYPNNPTGAVADRAFYEEAVAFGKRHNIMIASDEAYTENYYEERPPSILEVAREGVVAFHSLSKRSCMTGYRVGWVAGDARIIAAFKKLKPNIDSGTPTFIQDAAIAALSDEGHVQGLRDLYRKKRDLIVGAFARAGLPECRPKGALYIWQGVPSGYTSVSFAKRLLAPDMAVVVTPGSLLGETAHGANPGEGYVRLALVPGLPQCELAAEKIIGGHDT